MSTSHPGPPSPSTAPAPDAPAPAASTARRVRRAAAQDPDLASASGVRLEGLSVSLGGREIIPSLDLDIRRGEMLCLLGPSGCGKTTTLRMIGGFLQPDAGRILIGGTDWAGRPPEQRPTAMVFQSYALWPHMSVARNVGYPLSVRKVARAEREERVQRVLEMVGLEQKAQRRPARLSGGEQQRVALARALVQRPEVLLLDEPLSNLDARLRVQVREEIRAIQQELGITSVFVTHDQEEALAISDRIAVMDAGRIVQISDPVRLYRRPATEGAARFIGSMGLIGATLDADGRGPLAVLPDGGALRLGSATTAARGPALVGIRPEQVRLRRIADEGSGGAGFTVERVTPRGHDAVVLVRRGGVALSALAPVTEFAPGDAVEVGIGEALVYRDGMLCEDAADDAAGNTSGSGAGERRRRR